MKNILYLLVLLPLVVVGQTPTENYIKTTTYKIPTTTSIANPTITQSNQNITYFDGLGRPMQQIDNQQSATGKDIVVPIEYDAFGRQTKDYLPYVPNAAASLNYKPSALTDVLNFPQYYGQNPFSEKLFEASPLHRVLKQAAPGSDWALNSGHEIKLDYQTNTADEVQRFDVSLTADYVPSITANATYALGELYKTVTTDENNHSTEEFKDKEGRVVLKRNYDTSVANDTYYVYDVYGNLTYVLPPKAEGAVSATVLDELCYQYQYDYRNRLVAKKLPGKQWEYMVYDKLDRVVATGPAFSPFSDVTGAGWLITKYDVFNRVVYTGWLNSPATSSARSTMQQAQNTATTINESKQTSGTIDSISAYYSNTVVPTTFKLLTVNYYDNYTIPTVSPATTVEGQTVATATKGLPTGSWTRVPTTTAETKAETSYVLYDTKYRPIRNYTTNYLGGFTCTDSKLDAFSGQLQYTLQKHKRTSGDAELTVKEAFTYSAQNRLLTHTHQINGGAEQLLADNTYDELGKLTSKKVGNTSALPLQKVDYSYNVRGWLTQINEIKALQKGTDPKDLFGFTINYNTVDSNTSAASPLYNGNIAETFWQFGDDGDLVYRGYGYKYDSLNRLKDASYQRPGFNNPVPKSYDENLTYDKNGNIMTLKRNGDADDQLNLFTIDDLSYEYLANSNKLMRVSEAQQTATSGFKDGNITGYDYDYDDNGNLIKDKNKDITTAITYNHLNLPTKIIFPTGNIVYIYTASGQKMQKIVTEGASITTTDYLSGYQYQNTVLQFFPTAEGYVKNTPVSGTNTYSYVYNYTDHLGNVRLSYTQNPSTNALTILEENSYYPFGMKHTISNAVVQGQDYKYKFNGKELQDELQLNLYDFGSRNYDPALGRWMNIDPLAETSRRWNPYTYCYSNPLRFTDPDGMLSFDNMNPNQNETEMAPFGDYYDRNGNWLGKDKYDDNKVYAVDSVTKGDNGLVTSAENSKDLGITHTEFRKQASTVYGESSAYKSSSVTDNLIKEMFAIASVHQKNSLAFGASSDKAKEYLNLAPSEINKSEFKTTANAAVINAVTGGFDYSNGATMWDGREQALFSISDNRRSTGKFELHMNTMGWNITDSHFKTWKTNVGSVFQAPQQKEAPANFGNYNNKGMMRLQSTAVYGETIFWKIK